MTTWARRVSLALTFVGLGLVGPLPLTGAPAGAAGAPCSGRTGVTVVVDFGPLQGGTQQACVPSGSGDSAARVTSDAGFPITLTSDGQPFVCRISGQPDAQRESCSRTPPEDAYWGLYWSDGSSGWNYSNQGGTSLTAREGWSIGWRFQDGGSRDLPSAGPRRNTATSPSPGPSRSPKPTPSPNGPRPTAPSSSGSTSAGSAAGGTRTQSPTTSARPGRGSAGPSGATSPNASVSPSATPSATPSSTSSADEPALPTEDSTDEAEGSLGTVTSGGDDGDGLSDDRGFAAVAGLAGLSVLAGSAAAVAYRRRGRS